MNRLVDAASNPTSLIDRDGHTWRGGMILVLAGSLMLLGKLAMAITELRRSSQAQQVLRYMGSSVDAVVEVHPLTKAYSPGQFRGSRRSEIAQAWSQLLPGLDPRTRGMNAELLGVAFPLVYGIVLESVSNSTWYRPIAFVHLLGSGVPHLQLIGSAMARTEAGAPMELRVAAHPAGVGEAVRLLRSQAWFPLDRPPRLDEVLSGLRGYVRSRPHIPLLTRGELEVLVALPAMCGRPDTVAESLAFAASPTTATCTGDPTGGTHGFSGSRMSMPTDPPSFARRRTIS